jgi:DNA-binding GntR family transcriptional regulator
MSPTVDRPEPPYLQIVKRIRGQVRSGELRDGDMVPSTRKLAAEWNVSWPTAAKALTMLQSEGLVRGVAGVGTVVCAGVTAHNSGRDRLRSIWATGRIYPPNEHGAIKSASLAPAPSEIADALGLAPGTYVIRRHRVTYRDDMPISASVTWLDGKLAGAAPLLLTTERISQGTIGYIRETIGREVARGVDQDSARAATEQDADDLGVPVGSPVACGRNWWYDADDVVIEYGERVSIPGRWSTHEYVTA